MARDTGLEFKRALEKKRLLRFSQGNKLVGKELKAAEEDLAEAEDRYNNKRYKYATITAYYSMFHAARSLLYSKGYREKSHYCLLVALKYLFGRKKQLSEELIEDFHTAMVLREEADYYSRFSEEGARSALDSAAAFLKRTKSIL